MSSSEMKSFDRFLEDDAMASSEPVSKDDAVESPGLKWNIEDDAKVCRLF